MPYIKKEDRKFFEKELNLLGASIEDEGELNYCITKLCHLFLHMKGTSYKTYNKIIGVLECAKLEMYRRKVAYYEDIKIVENGDV